MQIFKTEKRQKNQKVIYLLKFLPVTAANIVLIYKV